MEGGNGWCKNIMQMKNPQGEGEAKWTETSKFT
jgi:hypothetical protein